MAGITTESRHRDVPDVPGVTLEEEIGRGAFSVVHRATRGGRSFAVKIQKRVVEQDRERSSQRFRREGAVLACLRHAALPAILDLGEVEGRPYLVQEYVRGTTLSERLATGHLTEKEVVALGRQLASALAEVHRVGMVHCDVKPDNILVDDALEARLIDFGFAVCAHQSSRPGEIVGTLQYSAPEQSDLLKRPVDGRSDLYSLGVVLFECVAGHPPFQSSDAAELARLHAVGQPPDVRAENPAVSSALAAVIHKLLAKDPDDRYQSGHGLLEDLSRLDALGQQLDLGQRQALGAGDDPSSAQEDSVLVGRESELAHLSRHWERVRRGRGSMVLVEGAAGLGKGRLVRELIGKARDRGALCLAGRCPSAHGLPFTPLSAGVERHIRSLLLLNEPQRDLAHKYIRSASGDAIALLSRSLPALAQMSPLAASDSIPTDQEDQAYDAVVDFLLRWARAAGSGLITIEDGQWLDSASKQVLLRLATRIADTPLLVVVTVTGAEGEDSVAETLADDLGSALALRLPLEPLDEDSVRRLVTRQLGETEAHHSVAQRIARRSGGNPFVAIEYVRSLVDAGMIWPSWGAWHVDEDAFDRLRLPSSAVELVLARLGELDPDLREHLRSAAVMGPRFEVERLTDVAGVEPSVVHETIADGLRTRVIERGSDGAYAFVHAALREALLEELSEEELRQHHQRIAQVLDDLDRDGREHVFAVARHYASGDVQRHAQRVCETNIRAGRLALSEHAQEDAYDFLKAAEGVSEDAGRDAKLELNEALGEVSARTGRIHEAVRYFEQCLDETVEPLARARLRAKLANTHAANFHMGPAWQEVQAGLRELGRPYQRLWIARLLVTLWYWVRGLLADKVGRVFRPTNDPQEREAWTIYIRLCEQGAIAAYFGSHQTRLVHLVLRSLYASGRLGRTAGRVVSYYQHAVGFATVGLQRRARRLIARAEALSEELDDRLLAARCQLYKGLVWHLGGDSIEAAAITRTALEDNGKWLDSLHYVDGAGDLVTSLMLRGYYDEAWVWVQRQMPRHAFMSGGVHGKQANPWAGPCLMIMGRTNESVRYQEMMRDFCEGAPRSERFLWGEMLGWRLMFQLEQGEYGRAMEDTIADFRRLGLTPRRTSLHFRGFFVFQAYARMEQAMRAPPGEVRGLVRHLARAVRELHQAARIPTLKAHALIIEGALRRLQGRWRSAYGRLEEASRVAREIDSPWVRFEVARQQAHLLREQHRVEASGVMARFARSIASEHQWGQRVRRLSLEFDLPELTSQSLSGSMLNSYSRPSGAGALRLQRQLDALLQVSLAAASVLDPEEHARVVLHEIVAIVGAERAFLFRLPADTSTPRFQAGRNAAGDDLAAPIDISSTVVDAVVARGEPLVISGTEEGAVIGSQSVVTHGLRSIVAVPLTVRDEVIGVLYADSRLARGVFTEDDVGILRALGTHVAIALETARAARLELRVEVEGQKRRLAEGLRDMSHALSSTLQLEEVLQRLLISVRDFLPCDRTSVLMREGEVLTRTVFWERDEGRVLPALTLDVADDPLLAEALTSLQPVLVRDTTRDGRITAQSQRAFLTAFVTAPLISDDEVVGLLVLESEEVGAFDVAAGEIAYTFAGQAGIAIQNARLFGEVQRLATTDELTRIYNRRQFFTLADRELSRAQRYERPLSVIMMDIDHFKRVNDTHGHAVGDEVLREVARRLQETIRDVDILGRYGGEEFAVLLPDTRASDALVTVAERLRLCIAETPVQTEAGALTVTVSLGLAQRSEDATSLTELLTRADGALYRAKDGGRNRTEVTTA